MSTSALRLSALFAAFLMLFGLFAANAQADADGGLKSLRGAGVTAPETEFADPFRVQKDTSPIARDYVQQPPLVPHKVEGYEVTLRYNKCMDCHSWSRYKEAGATKVSLTHFKDRNGQELSNISPRRYFCHQCHVPQADAKPLIANRFKPAEGVR